ncbi:substrate-binding domain-containing protein [Sorangium sp. So ce1014]|uniref:substrate-binding domain-containing protein n=1 Tax=Sorangium sp. So ce1014 TaxID=3133326 RepID=UPI003F5F52A1
MTTIGRCWMAAFGLTLTTAACGSSDLAAEGTDVTPITRAQTPDSEFTPVELEATVDSLVAEMNKSSLEPMQMVVLLKSLSDFFEPIATGASRAMGELEVTGNVLGPIDHSDDVTTTQDLQNQQIDLAVADGAGGIAVSPFGDVNIAAIDKAVANGVHVVTLDTDMAASKRSLYVGSLNKSAGATAANTLLTMLPEPPGTVLIHGSIGTDWIDGYERTQAAQDVIGEAGYTFIVTQAVFGDNEAYDVDWMKSRIVTADPPVIGLLGLFNISHRCVLAADAAGIPDVPIVAFDFDPKTVDYMRQGRIRATHAQRQYYEGYLVPYILYGIQTIGLDATKEILSPLMVDGNKVNIGFDMVPSGKIDAYNDFLHTIGVIQ